MAAHELGAGQIGGELDPLLRACRGVHRVRHQTFANGAPSVGVAKLA
jgi:hypothetical protein